MSRVLARSAAAGLALALAGHAAAQRPSRGAADACRRVDAHAGDRGSVFQPALLHGAAYRCTLRRGGPVVRVILAADGDG
ncbi:MAG TPA: hypothetical protein VGO40_04930, partial [Longimicrobium sp.]|nr:hypothetical protein [Longimicrobium sp.]